MFGLLVIFGQLWDEPWYGKNASLMQGLATSPHHIQLTGCYFLSVPGPIAAQRHTRATLNVGDKPQRACWVLIRYHSDYEVARIWWSKVRETSRHDLSVQRPFQGFGGATWAGSVPWHVVPDPAETCANSCAAVRSCRRPERRPRAAASGCDPYRS